MVKLEAVNAKGLYLLLYHIALRHLALWVVKLHSLNTLQ